MRVAGVGLVVSAGIVIACVDAQAAPCAAVAPGERTTCSLEQDGRAREYRIYVPRTAVAPAPVVVNLHGRKGTAQEQEERLAAAADTYGFIVVSPQGYERSWNAGVGFGPAHADGVDDVGFIRAVVNDVVAGSTIAIDKRRIFATGLSNGARMSHRLACEASDVFAAIASVAGPIADRNEDTGERAFDCKPPRPVAVMMIHGTADTCTPYAGGAGLDTRGNVATPLAAREWAQRDTCTRTTTHALGSTTCEVHRDCAAGSEVALCTVNGGGHVWPGGTKFPLWQACGGTWPDDFDATAQMWGFFSAHPMPGDSPQGTWDPTPVAPGAGPAWQQQLDLAPVESVDLPFDRSQLTLSLRGSAPSELDGGSYQDGSVALAGALSLYSRLRVRPGNLSIVRVMAQFRLESERVTSEMLGPDQQVAKGSLGITGVYVSPAKRLYALYAGVGIAETRDTISDAQLMPSAIALGTTKLGKLTWIYGGGLGYAFGKPWLLPAVGLVWQMGGGYSLTALAPVFVDVRKKLSRRTTVNVMASISGDRFNFTNDGQFAGAANNLQVRMGQGKYSVGVAYRLSRGWKLRGELGAVGPRRLDIVDGDTTVMRAEGKGAGYLATALTYGFGNAPL